MILIKASPECSAEKAYVCYVLFEYFLGVSWRIEWREGADYEIHTPGGKQLVIEDHFFKKTGNSYLDRANMPCKPVDFPHPLQQYAHLTAIWGNDACTVSDECIRIGGDIIASAFFLLSRWEEFVLPDRDQHGRFPASASFLGKNGLLHRPLVQEYLDLLGDCLWQMGIRSQRPAAKPRLVLSHDVDHPWLWQSPLGRLATPAAALLKRFDPQEAFYWLRRHSFRPGDPYDTFDGLMRLAEAYGARQEFNFLGKRSRDSDCYYPHDAPFVRRLMDTIAERGHTIGFHPSYEAFGNRELFMEELDSLQRISPTPIRSGRQHYLRFEAPHTWQLWEDAGLQTDSSLGYAEKEGFRCGICDTFPVFNILTRQKLNLLEQPVTAMDVSMVIYQKMQEAETTATLQRLAATVRQHRGEFVLLWHNSSLNSYLWRHYDAILQQFVHDFV